MDQGASSSQASQRDERVRSRRHNEKVYRKRRLRLALGFVVFCVVVVAVVLALTAGGSTAQMGSQSMLVSSGPAPSAAVAADPSSHPAFARLGDRNLLLPVLAKDATIIAYQPVSDEQAVQFSPMGQQANCNAMKKFFRGIFSGDASISYYLLPGDGGGSTGAILVGAPAGASVTSPISGTVTAVKDYKLYGKYDDVRVDIRPDEMSGITFSILFLENPAVSIDEVVTAGKTALGKVRGCPEELSKKLSVFTHDAGSHLFMQATEEPIR